MKLRFYLDLWEGSIIENPPYLTAYTKMKFKKLGLRKNK